MIMQISPECNRLFQNNVIILGKQNNEILIHLKSKRKCTNLKLKIKERFFSIFQSLPKPLNLNFRKTHTSPKDRWPLYRFGLEPTVIRVFASPVGPRVYPQT